MTLWILLALPFAGSVLAALLPTNARTTAAVGAATIALAGVVLLADAFPHVTGGGGRDGRPGNAPGPPSRVVRA